MTVVYRSELAEVHHGDARDVLPGIANQSVDLAIADPPYGKQWRSERRAESFDVLANDTPADRAGIAAVLAECVRLVGQHRHLYVFGPVDVLDGLKVSDPVALVWDKGTLSGGDLTAPWGPAHEPITFAVSRWDHAGESGCPVPARMRKGSVLRFNRPTGRKVRHPSEKPVPLLRELVESSTRAGDLVLDPFAGIGSTGVAAILSGRRCLLVELDARYVPTIIDRLRSAERIAADGARV